MVLIFACLFHPVTLLFIASKWSCNHVGIQNFLISACLLYPVALLFIASEWFDCHWRINNDADLCLSVPPLFIGCMWSDCHLEFRMVLISGYPCHFVVLLFKESEWSDCDWRIQNGTDFCLSIPPSCSLIHRGWGSDVDWGIKNGANLCLSIPPCYCLIHSK